ncbi:Phosphatidylcholine translocator ABCB4 [Nymphon striatum]|nr:Phosphatidylcholine translocator ABCB4 [Nymphon striatum]
MHSGLLPLKTTAYMSVMDSKPKLTGVVTNSTSCLVNKVFFALAFSALSVGEWSSYLPDYTKAKLSAGLMFHMMEMEPTIDSSNPGGIRPEIVGEVQLNNIYFRYPSRPDITVLRGLSLYVKNGQTVALVGPSGCGKSTVMSLLERVLRSSQRRSGKILQIEINMKIFHFIGYGTLAGEKGTQLSGGQKQRIAIARAMVRNPRVLLLDEATSALDTESEKLVQDALDVAKKGRTCIVIAHRLSTIQNADLIAVVDKGRIAELGTHSDLVAKKGIYYRLTKRQRILN